MADGVYSRRFQTIAQIAVETAEEITRSAEDWKRFLRTAGEMYRYPFKDQLLIYAQRPEAKAVATMDYWNKQMKCWIKRGSKGIALIDEDLDSGKLKYVFDVTDTIKLFPESRSPYLWQMQKEDEKEILQSLEKTYGRTMEADSFVNRIAAMAEKIAFDVSEDITDDLIKRYGMDFFGTSDCFMQIEMVKETIKASMVYQVLHRCGVEDEKIDQYIDFQNLKHFRDFPALCTLGDTVASLAKPILIDMEKTIHRLEKKREWEQKQQKKIDEKTVPEEKRDFEEIPLAQEHEQRYDNRDLDELIAGVAQQVHANLPNGGKDNGTELQDDRGVPDPGSTTERDAGGLDREVRGNAETVSEGAPERDVYRTDAEREAEGTSAERAGRSERDGGAADRTDGEERRRDGGVESERSDGLGAEDEQHSEPGGGDREFGTDLHVEVADLEYEQLSLFPLIADQIEGITEAAEQEKKPDAAFLVSYDMVDDILRTGGGAEDSKIRIYAKYAEETPAEDMIGILQNEYGRTGKGFTFDHQAVSVWFDETGMRIKAGMSAKGKGAWHFRWEEIEQRIRHMVKEGSYIDRAAALFVVPKEFERVAEKLQYFFRDGIDGEKLGITFATFSVPERVEQIKEMLKTYEGRKTLMDALKMAERLLTSGEEKLHWRYVATPQELIPEIMDLSCLEYGLDVYPLQD